MFVIAREWMSRPTLFWLDEPSPGLAPVLALQVFDTIQEISRQGTTMSFSASGMVDPPAFG